MLVVLFVAAAVAVMSFLARGPLAATNQFVAMIDEGRLDDAYASLCPEARQSVTIEQFRADHAAGSRITAYTFASLGAPSRGLTWVGGTVEVDGSPRSVDYGLREADSGWVVCTYPPLPT